MWQAIAIGLVIVCCLLLPNLAGGQQNATPSHQQSLHEFVNLLAEPYVAKRDHCRLTIGVLQDGKRFVFSFGSDQPPDPATPDDRVIYEIGSITKVFTGILLAQSEQAGLVNLDDPIGNHLPDGFAVSPEVAVITLQQLSTHTSGLPRLPTNLSPFAKDPYAKYGVDDLKECLKTITLNNPPGKSRAYSNLGAALLGYIIATKRGESFDEAVRNEICKPLGMSNTTTELTDSQKPRMIVGHHSNGEVAPNWTFDVMVPAGELRSTVHDMLVFAEANVGDKELPLQKALDRARESFHRTKTRNAGLGWQIHTDSKTGQTIHWHNGGTAGYISFIGIDKPNGCAVVLLSNYGDAFAFDSSIDRMAFEILKHAATTTEN